MASTAAATAYSSRAGMISNETDTGFSTLVFRPSSRRNSSFSSSPSFSSNSSLGSFSFHDTYDSSPFSPNTPLRFSSGIPFSWEQLPGIPKNKTPRKKESSSAHNLDLPLPVPPAGNSNSSRKNSSHCIDNISPKKYSTESFRKDPFFAALVECSKDDNHHHHHHHHSIDDFWKNSKVTKTLSDRFGFINMYTSCKRTSAVSESIVYLPRSRAYNMLNRRQT